MDKKQCCQRIFDHMKHVCICSCFRSIGCILYELCHLDHAFEGQSLMGVMYKIVEGNLPTWPKKYSTELKKVFEK